MTQIFTKCHKFIDVSPLKNYKALSWKKKNKNWKKNYLYFRLKSVLKKVTNVFFFCSRHFVLCGCCCGLYSTFQTSLFFHEKNRHQKVLEHSNQYRVSQFTDFLKRSRVSVVSFSFVFVCLLYFHLKKVKIKDPVSTYLF